MRVTTIFHPGAAARPAVWLLVLAGLMLAGCHKSSSDGGGAPDGGGSGDDSAITAVRTATWALVMFTESARQAQTTYDRDPAGTTPQSAATCPAFRFDRTTTQHVLDYGAGCTGADGRTRSGRLTATALHGARVGLGYDGYRVGETRVDGRVSLRPGPPATLTIRDGVLVRSRDAVAVEMKLEMEAERKTRAGDAGRYLLSGAGTVATAGGTVTFAISDALVREAACPYPSAGAMTVTRSAEGGPDVTTTVRFAAPEATCDDVAEVTLGRQVVLISLAQPWN